MAKVRTAGRQSFTVTQGKKKITGPPALGDAFMQGIKGTVRTTVFALVHLPPGVDSVLLHFKVMTNLNENCHGASAIRSCA